MVQMQSTEGRATRAELKPNDHVEGSMPSVNRRDIVKGLGAMLVALATGETQAQTETNGKPGGVRATPGNAPAMTDKSDITSLPDRNFCMDDDGNVLVPNRTQVRRIGQQVQGLPSNGEAFRAICEGVAHLKSMNGGQIPAGQDVKLRIFTQKGEDVVQRSFTLNPEKLSTIADLCPAALDTAMADPLNRRAIEGIRKELDMHVVRSGPNTVSVGFIGKEPGQAVKVTVELAPRQ